MNNNIPSIDNFDPLKAGFKCGLEVHQQLLTDKKLFCRCPAGLYSDEYHAQVVRHMRPTLSELGEYDGTALMEFKTHKEIIYRLNKNSVCTYEMDDNPPFPINQEAVDIAIEIALLLNCSIVGELHIIRKQYLDGSIPAGFQRTGIIGVNGWIPFKDRRINIIQISLEEDSCREVSDVGHLRTYTTDRLSMPLIEAVTAPEILTPEESAEVGHEIGRLLRSTKKVRRGLGTIRQDVNASVEGGTRIEIKGVPRLQYFPSLVYHEAFRQYSLLKLRDRLHGRGIHADSIETTSVDVTDIIRKSRYSEQLLDGHVASAIVLKGMKDLLSHPIGRERTFSHDVAGRLRVIACLSSRPIFINSDDAGPFKIPSDITEAVRSSSRCGADDTVAVVWGEKRDVETALREIVIRLQEACTGIPNETRQRLATGETDFERILPGPDRMYPDTDSPPYEITRERVKAIEDTLPTLPWVLERRFVELGVSKDLARRLSDNHLANDFEVFLAETNAKPNVVAGLIVDLALHYKRICGGKHELVGGDVVAVLNLVKKCNLTSAAIRLIIESAGAFNSKDWQAAAERVGLLTSTKTDSDAQVSTVSEILSGIKSQNPAAIFKCAMQRAMLGVRGKIEGAEISAALKSKLSLTG